MTNIILDNSKNNRLSKYIFAGNMMDISDKEFELLRGFIYDNFGINLTDQKRSLLVRRLQKQIRSLGFDSFSDYYEYLVADKNKDAISCLINLISTNYTYFSREISHFDYLSGTVFPNIVKQLKAQNSYEIRIWCAGCSSGQEAYMLSILLFKYFGSECGLWDSGVLATDISTKALEVAKSGIYHEEQLTKLSNKFKNNYFKRLENGEWEVLDKLKKKITFRRFNLINKEFPFKKPFHIIFCRNVMIYFDKPTRDELIKKFHKFLHPYGYLFIGHSETLSRNQSLFKYLGPAIYQRI